MSDSQQPQQPKQRPEHHDHKDLRQTLATIEEDKQAALELLHAIVICEDVEKRERDETALAEVITGLFDISAEVEQQLTLWLSMKEVTAGLPTGEVLAEGIVELNMDVVKGLTGQKGEQPAAGQ